MLNDKSNIFCKELQNTISYEQNKLCARMQTIVLDLMECYNSVRSKIIYKLVYII